MNDNESKRLLYRPVLEQTNKIDTSYDGGNNSSLSIGTPGIGKIPAVENHIPSLTNIVKSYVKFSTPKSLKIANNLLTSINKKLVDIKNKLLQDTTYNQIVTAKEVNDRITLDKYRTLAENIDGEILPETYPLLKNLQLEVEDLINIISKNGYDGKLDLDDIDNIIINDNNLKISITERERAGVPINYKEIEVDTQISKFLEDRINLLSGMYRDILKLQTEKPTLKVLLPKDNEFVNDYYDNLLEIYNSDKSRMECFTSTGIITSILNNVYTLKNKVLRNRQLLSEADKDTFFGMLPLTRSMEDKLLNSVVDLYKAQMVDEINKGDYINSLTRKTDMRQFYNDNVRDI